LGECALAEGPIFAKAAMGSSEGKQDKGYEGQVSTRSVFSLFCATVQKSFVKFGLQRVDNISVGYRYCKEHWRG
jgi:hypothetical protein